MMKHYTILILVAFALGFASCGNKQKSNWSGSDTIALKTCPQFCADSAFRNVEKQCEFGPRVTGTKASDLCGAWIVEMFRQYGCVASEQIETVTTWDGSQLKCRNINASLNPKCGDRIMICSHWDSRPWADNDSDEKNHHTPVLAANDGASGVAVMIEMARVMSGMLPKSIGVDFVCFDAEDLGTPQWSDIEETENTWCLGSKAWSVKASEQRYSPRYGVLLDMVGGRGATFAKEQVSVQYASPVVEMIWALANQLGYGQFFPNRTGGMLIDDHVNVNTIAGIPCIDIVPNHSDGPSSFGPTWHTVDDTPENIDPNVLKAVGQTLLQMIYNDDK